MTRRLLMTADAVGGVWTYALELARALGPHDIAVTLATMGPTPSTDQVASAAEIVGLDLVTSTFALEWMDDPWDGVAAAGAWLLELERQVRPAVVHLNGYAHGALPWRSPVVVVGHSCVMSWMDAVGADIDPAWLRRYADLVRRGLRAADCVVAPSAAVLSALQRHYGPLPCASVIPNGRDPAHFHVGGKEPFIFAAGRLWDRAKNVAAIDAIANRLRWPVIAAGEGGDDSGVDGGRRGAMVRLGALNERTLASWLARASIFVAPARYEPFGLLPLEAALSGCALVLGDIASLREVWAEAAVYVDPDDHDRLCACIDHLLDDPSQLARYASLARERARRYTPAAMAAAYARLYDGQLSIVDRRPAARAS